jgi:hypothetical protein
MATTFSRLIQSARGHLNEIYNLVTPGSPLVSPQGTTGATSYSYKVVARNSLGTSVASQAGTTTTGNATLSGSNFNRLTWTEVPYAASYDIYRTVGGATTGKIVSATTALTADDTGLAGDSAAEPTVNTSGVTQAFWTDSELLEIASRGITDLWAGILDLHQEHFLTIDNTNVSLAANATELTGVPADVFRVHLIEPRSVVIGATGRNIEFEPRDINSADFRNARSMSSVSVDGVQKVFYALIGAGSPVSAPTIKTAPALSSALDLTIYYVPALGVSTSYPLTTSNNPIPGESDNAVIAWIVAYARAKEREDRMPDPGWLGIYGTEKQSLLVRMTPRQTQQPDVVEGMFEGYW